MPIHDRSAYTAEGHNQDRDVVAASAIAIARFGKADLARNLVHGRFYTNFGSNRRAPQSIGSNQLAKFVARA